MPVKLAKSYFYLQYQTIVHDKPDRYYNLQDAKDAYREYLAECSRFGSTPLDATVHIATSRNAIAEYPDYYFSVGPRGGLKVDRT